VVKDVFKEVAIVEMKHAEIIAERISYLGGKPTTELAPIIDVGETLKEMLENDVKVEESTIEFYRRIIDRAMKEGDITTAEIFRGLLKDKEEHHDTFSSILEEV